jgi:hypothetical protein
LINEVSYILVFTACMHHELPLGACAAIVSNEIGQRIAQRHREFVAFRVTISRARPRRVPRSSGLQLRAISPRQTKRIEFIQPQHGAQHSRLRWHAWCMSSKATELAVDLIDDSDATLNRARDQA